MTRRFIPAGAGNTSRGGCISPGCAVYPRWRGEHDYTRGVIQDCTGLSPLARGTLAQCQISYVSARFIPAGAGNTASAGIAAALDAVYPRWRGEHRSRQAITSPMSGLSPLARGTLSCSYRVYYQARFIPAGAGNTLKIYYCLIISF